MNLGRSLQRLCLTLALVFASGVLYAQAQRVEVQLSANKVSVDESVIFTVRAYGMDEDIDASALNADFDVSTRSSSRQITIENGKRTSLVEWVLELLPKRTGTLEVPPVIVGSEQSRPLTLLVEQQASGADRDLYLEASVDVANPYVQAQVIYTLRVFQDVRFLDASLQVPEIDGAIMQQLSDEKSYQETVEGRNYVVSEIRYSLFPQQSGSVSIPGISLQAVVAANAQQVPNTRTRTRRITRRANQIELDVQARPDGLAGSWWLPAKDVKLQSEWSASIDRLQVDQPVTRTIHVMATGVGEAQLPELVVPEIPNISVYADSPTANTNSSDRGLISQQTNTWAIIPQLPGSLVLPEVRVNWFDTQSGEARVAVLPEETLTVAAAAATPSPTSPSTDATSATPVVSRDNALEEMQVSGDAVDTDAALETVTPPSPTAQTDNGPKSDDTLIVDDSTSTLDAIKRWRSIAVVLALAWPLSLLALWVGWRRSVNQRQHTESQAREFESSAKLLARRAGSKASLESIRTACESGDASATANAVLAWAAMLWPDDAPSHISTVAQRLNSAALADIFQAIDAQQYAASAGVKPVALGSVPELIKSAVEQYGQTQPPSAQANALPSL